MSKIIEINKKSNQPKYIQIVNSVIGSIENGKLVKGAQLPSINELAEKKQTAKATVAKAYEQLRERGIIISQHGKGFYVAKTEIKNQLNVFVLFDNFNPYKEILYNALKTSLPESTEFSIFFHHYNLSVFENLINNNIGKFNYYVILPHFDGDVSRIVNRIPRDKLIILDKDVPRLQGPYTCVYQDFENDIFRVLQNGISHLLRYKRFNLVLGREHLQYVPADILKGFKRFGTRKLLPFKIWENLDEKMIRKDEAYLIFSDVDLIKFIKNILSKNWIPGKDVGLISYDDTPLKEILLHGVTVISTDFEAMGKTAGHLMLTKTKEKFSNPFH
nr:GntR family transcriptional regulator [Chitinophagaceae bacterium]